MRSSTRQISGLLAATLGLFVSGVASGKPAPRQVATSPAAPAPGAPAPGAPGEGFVKTGTTAQGTTVKRLVDDPGRGEAVPRIRLEPTLGLSGAEGVPVRSGPVIGLAALFRPAANLWLGAQLDYQALTGSGLYESLSHWSTTAQVRYYFMPHKEAYRFIMGYLLFQLGYGRTAVSGAGSATTSQAFELGLGVGAGVALSTKVYLGLQFKYLFPAWLHVCRDDGQSRPCQGAAAGNSDFTVTYWQLAIAVSQSF